VNGSIERERVDGRRFTGGARKQFVAAVEKLADEVRQGRSPSECWREVDRALETMRSRLPRRQS
jgi:hypothetical protein